MRAYCFLAVLAVGVVGSAEHAVGEDQIWSAIVLASKVDAPSAPAPALRSFAPQLARVFGYNQFEIVGEHSATVAGKTELSLTPTKTFWLNLQARPASVKEAKGGYLLGIEFFQNTRPLVDTVALLAPGSPLFLRGPLSKRGQIILVVGIRKDS